MRDVTEAAIRTHPAHDGEALLVLAGDLDLSHVDELWEAAVAALASGPERLVLDTSRITFLNSTTLGTFVRIQRRSEEVGAAFSLRGPTPLVSRLLRLSGLDGHLRVEP